MNVMLVLDLMVPTFEVALVYCIRHIKVTTVFVMLIFRPEITNMTLNRTDLRITS